MMIQSAPADEPRFICMMAEHNELCGQFVRAFGNDDFERPEPFEEMVYVVSHHDRGWVDHDHNAVVDAKSGFPCGLGTARPSGATETSTLSPDFNERKHPYCGLLSSMHSWGLYNARYGFSEFRVRPGRSASVPRDDVDPAVANAMLEGEMARQERLKAVLADDPATRAWIEDAHLFQNYKQLQFFDTLALYFNLRHESARREEVYVHVPKSADEDCSVTVRPLGGGEYGISPFPFAGDRLEARCHGRYMRPVPADETPDDLGAMLRALPAAEQVYTLVAA